MLPAERSSASSELAATRLSTVIRAALALKGKIQASQKKIDRRFMDPLPLPAVVQAWVRGAPVQLRNGFTVISPPRAWRGLGFGTPVPVRRRGHELVASRQAFVI